MHTNNSLVLAQISVLHVHEEVDKLVWDISIICYQELLNMQWHPTPLLLSGKSHGRRSLESCSPWGHWGSDTTERLHFHFSLSCIGEGNGNPLQRSCPENPRDGGSLGGLPSMGSHRVGHDLAAAAAEKIRSRCKDCLEFLNKHSFYQMKQVWKKINIW